MADLHGLDWWLAFTVSHGFHLFKLLESPVFMKVLSSSLRFNLGLMLYMMEVVGYGLARR